MNAMSPSQWAMNFDKLFFLILLVFSTFFSVSGQAPVIEWNRTLGGENWEELNTVVSVEDGIVFGGTAQSIDWTFPGNGDAFPDFSLFKLDFDGNLLWKQAFGGDLEERVWALARTNDGGFIMGGGAESAVSGNKTAPNKGDRDFWIVKVDKDGNKQWDRSYGGSGYDECFSVIPMPNGDYILSGNSDSHIGSDKTANSRGGLDVWVLRINANGNVLWDRTVGGNGQDRISSYRSVRFAPDGNLVLAGGTTSGKGNGDIADEPAFSGNDFWLLKINAQTGSLMWNHRYGGYNHDFAYGLMLSRNKQFYYMWGESSSDGVQGTQIASLKTAPYLGTIDPSKRPRDFWLIKVDLDGNKLPNFDMAFGGGGDDGLYDVNENIYGDLILGGYSNSPKMNGLGDHDWKVLCIDKFGVQKWAKSFGGSGLDAMTKIERLDNGAMVFIGHSASEAGPDKDEPNLGLNDFYIVKTFCDVDGDIIDYPVIDPCESLPMTLEIEATGCDTCLYYWDFGHVGRFYEVQPGFADTISIVVANKHACVGMDTGYYQVNVPLEWDLLVKDTTILASSSVLIGGNNPELQYNWNTSDTTATLVVATAGVYTVTVTDEYGCSSIDWVRVRTSAKESVYIPNVFTPNFDGADDYFNIYADHSVDKVITLQVYDRWGGQLYRRDDFPPNFEDDGWDGLHRGRRVPPGGYKYIAVIQFIDGSTANFEGIITVMR